MNTKPLALPQHALKTSEFAHGSYVAGVGMAPLLPPGTTLDDVLRPNFWVHHAKQLKAGDLVRVREPTGAWDLMLVVIDTDAGGATLRPWPINPIPTATVEEPSKARRK